MHITRHAGQIWTISGPAGVGKTTLLKGLLTAIPNSRPLLRVTTRPRRPSDIVGEYEYLQRTEFMFREQHSELAWHIEHHGNCYGVPKSVMEEALAGECMYACDLSVKSVESGVAYARTKHFGSAIRSIYLDVTDEEELRRRMIERGESDIDRRILDSREWRQQALSSNHEFCFVNAAASAAHVLEEVLTLCAF